MKSSIIGSKAHRNFTFVTQGFLEMDDDIFSVFNEAPKVVKRKLSPSATADGKNDNKRAHSVESSPKTTAPQAKVVSDGAKKPVSEEPGKSLANESSSNKRKVEKPAINPIVADLFETEATTTTKAVDSLLSSSAKSTSGDNKVTGDSSEPSDKIVLSHQVKHQVALPPAWDYSPIGEHKIKSPARMYPFTLDPFQATSIACIDRGESVLVSAHTSAGKTVVAEYAIAQSLRNSQRVIYTSPIKALSNQKYRELQKDFGDVGLMTGDVTINPDASCLVMTTEILRSMLYRGSEIMREVAWVIFDEIHYMRDKERGVVWEETIILLPDNVHYVFLSATIPNAMQFAEWIVQIHSQPCHVVYTNFRPTPLQHYLFPSGGEGIYLVVDEKGTFREDNFQKAMGIVGEKLGQDPGSVAANGKGKRNAKGIQSYKGGNKNEMPDIYKIIKMIMLKNFNPVIVFSFSKRDCENLALQMSKLDFNSADEHEMIEKVFKNAISQLSEEDRALPQISNILPLLRRGIGIHHSGLLPILKEVIEILFQEGLIKCLFATETFSIGLNMPAKTVVFTGVRKFDGQEQRWLSGGEYIQMSGRAGRRGLDDRGLVVLMIDEQMDPSVAKGMVKGEADRLNSAFHLGYNMILNLLRVEGISPEFLLERCFFQFQHTAQVPVMKQDLERLEAKFNEVHVEDEDQIGDYYDIRQQLKKYENDFQHIISHPSHCLSYLQPGRLVYVQVSSEDASKPPKDFGWCAVTGHSKRPVPRKGKPFSDHESYTVSVICYLTKTAPVHVLRKGDPKLIPGIDPALGDDGKSEIISITLNSIRKLSSLRLQLPKDLSGPEQRRAVHKSINEVKRRFPDGIPLLDPIQNMHIKDDFFDQLVAKMEMLESKLATNPLQNSPRLNDLYQQYSAKMTLKQEIKDLQGRIGETQSIIQMDELKNRKRVLRKLGFIKPDDDIVELKGRVACEISSGDELLLTELIFNNTFSSLAPEICVALLSCFVFDEKSKEQYNLPPALQDPLKKLQQMARQIAKISRECRIEVVEDDYVQSFQPHLMDVVYSWAKGSSFGDICKMTDVYEGSLIRLFRRLEELIRQVGEAAKVMGNEELADKMEKCLQLIQRDLVSAASLYL